MKFVFGADLHGNLTQYRKLFDYATENIVDLIVLGGDLTPKNPELRNPTDQKRFISDGLFPLIKDFKGKVFLIMGNDDYKANYDFLKQNQDEIGFSLIDNKSELFDGYNFVGYTYVPYTPFKWKDWEKRDLKSDTKDDLKDETRTEGFRSKGDNHMLPYSIFENMMDDSIEEDLENIVKDIPSNKLVLITHAPPYNTDCDYTKLKDGGFAHVGSKAIYKIIENKQPILTLHGHIHDTVQVTGNFPCEIGKTISCAVSSDHIGDNPYVVNASINDGVVFVERVKL